METFGCPVYINPKIHYLSQFLPVFVDVETDEQDNFVGIGLTQNGHDLYYLTDPHSLQLLGNYRLIGHNLKFDAHMLRKWGVDLTPENLVDDTMLMSYSIYGSSKSHSLKSLAKELLDMEWKSYQEMVTKTEEVVSYQKYETWLDEQGKRKRKKLDEPKKVIKLKKTKVTLDKQPVGDVAKYCCTDVLATYRLTSYFQSQNIDRTTLQIYKDIELPTMQAIYAMENRGINLDVAKLQQLDKKVEDRIAVILEKCKEYAGDINIGSSKQLAPVLEEMGFWLPTTQKGNKSVKKAVLEMYKTNPFVNMLLEHSVLKKLNTSFTKPLSELRTLPRVYPTFNQVRSHEEEQVGISTGRLSCSNPNLQQIPRRSDIAKEVRQLFIPDEGKVLVVADFSQVEPRVLAHLSKDWYLQDVFKTGKDMYRALIKGTPWESKTDGRDIGKTFYLALSYGAQAKKLAKVFKVTVEEAQRLMQQCWDNIPQVKEWQMKTIAKARQTGYVNTLHGRKRFLPELHADDFFTRSSAERKAINTPVQGTAADIMKLTMVALHKAGYPIQLVVHDEIILSVDKEDVEMVMDDIKHIMETIVELDVPLKVDIHSGRNWNDAKE